MQHLAEHDVQYKRYYSDLKCTMFEASQLCYGQISPVLTRISTLVELCKIENGANLQPWYNIHDVTLANVCYNDHMYNFKQYGTFFWM